MTRRRIPIALTIAGSDSGGGAGAQADLKTFAALRVHGTCAITCLTAQNPRGVRGVQAAAPAMLRAQLEAVFAELPPAACKTGMLCSEPLLRVVVEFFRQGGRPPLVVDPVLMATSGARLLSAAAMRLLQRALLPLATLVTPNLDEVRTLLGRPVTSVAEMRRAGLELAAQFGTNFLIKGGHLRETIATDLLCEAGGAVHEFSAPFVPGVSTHGTGCTYAAAITAGLGKGLALREAVGEAKEFLTRAVANFLSWERPGGRTDALHHFAK